MEQLGRSGGGLKPNTMKAKMGGPLTVYSLYSLTSRATHPIIPFLKSTDAVPLQL
jgi:hypothetical protein